MSNTRNEEAPKNHRNDEGEQSGSVDVRGVVLDILVEHETKGTYSNILIKHAQDRYESLPLTQRSFLKRLCEGTIERKTELDADIDRHLKDPNIRLKTTIRCLLRMSIYQIYYMNSVPDFAACSEAVRLCRERHLERQAGFVNGLLRSVCREKERQGRAPKEETFQEGTYVRTRKSDAVIVVTGDQNKLPEASIGRISRETSMPEEILRLWQDQLGGNRAAALSEAMLLVRPVCMHLDYRLEQKQKEVLLQDLTQAGVELTPARYAEDGFYMRHLPASVGALPGFAEGKWVVQDESSQLVAYAAGLRGPRKDVAEEAAVYDICASPGGKTILAASLLPRGTVYAFDLTREKTDRIRESIKRMHLENVVVSENDAQSKKEELFERADLLLCDVPCSGLGVMTRKRDIKYNVTMQKIRSLVVIQKKIAANAASILKPGGVLIYSTCTIDRLENEKIADYMEKELGLLPESLSGYLPAGIPGISKNRIQLYPDVHGTDGFFIARFKKPLH